MYRILYKLTSLCVTVHYIFCYAERGQLNRQTFARLDRSDNYTFVFESGFNVSIVYPGIYTLLC